MAAVCGDIVVVFATEGKRANGDRFLPYVKVQEASDFSALIILQAGLLKATNANHLTVEFNFSLWSKGLVDGRVGEVQSGHVESSVGEIGCCVKVAGTGGKFYLA